MGTLYRRNWAGDDKEQIDNIINHIIHNIRKEKWEMEIIKKTNRKLLGRVLSIVIVLGLVIGGAGFPNASYATGTEVISSDSSIEDMQSSIEQNTSDSHGIQSASTDYYNYSLDETAVGIMQNGDYRYYSFTIAKQKTYKLYIYSEWDELFYAIMQKNAITDKFENLKYGYVELPYPGSSDYFSYCNYAEITLNAGSYVIGLTYNDTVYELPNYFGFIVETPYTAAFDGNGGSNGVPAKNQYEKGEKVGTLPTSYRAGYDFTGWFTDRTGGTIITADTLIQDDSIFYAHWLATPPPDSDKTPPQSYEPGDVKAPVAPVAITKAPKVTSKKNSVAVTVPKTAGATGYNIRYRTGKGKWNTVTVKGNNPKSKTIKKLKKGKNYTFQIRSIKKVGGKTYYAKWSKTRTVKIKK